MFIYRLRTCAYLLTVIYPYKNNETVITENVIKKEKEMLNESEKITITSPLHEKRILLLLVKKQMIGRRAYSDITKVKPSNRETKLYENHKQNIEVK
jgi:hypothetical protein